MFIVFLRIDSRNIISFENVQRFIFHKNFGRNCNNISSLFHLLDDESFESWLRHNTFQVILLSNVFERVSKHIKSKSYYRYWCFLWVLCSRKIWTKHNRKVQNTKRKLWIVSHCVFLRWRLFFAGMMQLKRVKKSDFTAVFFLPRQMAKQKNLHHRFRQ